MNTSAELKQLQVEILAAFSTEQLLENICNRVSLYLMQHIEVKYTADWDRFLVYRCDGNKILVYTGLNHIVIDDTDL